ncbi:hypothetical protein GCM10017783_23610 [Deinococcus piscis]|uniref:histidine kinase n=1 Tax=Deinococcus piscis TaxID=394230 RepID=A0ABQ3KB96_9DEIO|nr:histidine kinase [Deinococcus piscis]GHG10457.1 hypothetical protein GCM10017783_23610 [Deinococcus piscis]
MKFEHWWHEWYAERPTARAAVLFSGLNLLPILLFTLVFPPLRLDMQTLPVTDPAEITVRLLAAALAFSLIVWALRPGQRAGQELWALGGAALALTAFYAQFYPLSLLLAVLPLLLRVWLSFRRTLLVSLLVSVPVTALDAFLNHFVNAHAAPDWGRWLALLPWWLGFALVVNFYTLTAFEFAYREALLRRNLAALSEAHLEFASLSERARISRELHDTLGHHLMTARLNLQVLARQDLSPGARATLSTLEESNAAAVSDLRSAVRLLRPLSGERNLVDAVDKLLERPGVTFAVQGQELPLNEAQRLTLYRAAQESLSNALKHAPGHLLTLNLHFDEDGVRLEAINTAGPALGDPAGLGLAGLRERVTELGGTFSAGREGGCFRLSLHLPVQP